MNISFTAIDLPTLLLPPPFTHFLGGEKKKKKKNFLLYGKKANVQHLLHRDYVSAVSQVCTVPGWKKYMINHQ